MSLSLFPHFLQNTSAIRDGQRGPRDALIYFLRFLRFLRNSIGVKTSNWWGRWLDQAKDTLHKAKVAVSSSPSAPLNGITEFFDKPFPTMGRGTLVWLGIL